MEWHSLNLLLGSRVAEPFLGGASSTFCLKERPAKEILSLNEPTPVRSKAVRGWADDRNAAMRERRLSSAETRHKSHVNTILTHQEKAFLL